MRWRSSGIVSPCQHVAAGIVHLHRDQLGTTHHFADGREHIRLQQRGELFAASPEYAIEFAPWSSDRCEDHASPRISSN